MREKAKGCVREKGKARERKIFRGSPSRCNGYTQAERRKKVAAELSIHSQKGRERVKSGLLSANDLPFLV